MSYNPKGPASGYSGYSGGVPIFIDSGGEDIASTHVTIDGSNNVYIPGGTFVSGYQKGNITELAQAATPYALANTDYAIFVNTTAAFVINLTQIGSTWLGRTIFIKNIGTGTIAINAFSGDSIDGSASLDIDVQYQSYTIVAGNPSGNEWHIV